MAINENSTKSDSYDGRSSFFFFLAFLRHKIDQDRARQVNIARAIGVRPEYINRVYKGRQTCSVHVQENICRSFGIPYMEALTIGRHLLETGELPALKSSLHDSPLSSLADQERRLSANISETDIVSIVSQWVADKKESDDARAHLYNILENLIDGVVILDPDLVVDYQNRAHREIFGRSLVGETCSANRGDKSYPANCPSLVAKKTRMPATTEIPHAKGISIALSTPIRDMSGKITGYVEVHRDITALHDQLLMIGKALEMTGLAVLVCDDTRKILSYSPALQEITGASEADLTTTERLVRHLQDNGIWNDGGATADRLEQARKDRKEVSVTIPFSNGATYLFTVKPMYSGERYIGRAGVFFPK